MAQWLQVFNAQFWDHRVQISASTLGSWQVPGTPAPGDDILLQDCVDTCMYTWTHRHIHLNKISLKKLKQK